MKLKFKLSILVIAILAIVVAGIAFILVAEATKISIDLSKRGIEYLAAEQASFWKGREDGYIRMLNTVAAVMKEYEDIPVLERRDRFDHTLYGVLEAEPNLFQIYTVWKPNALDGMDAQYIGRIGSSPTGQYAMTISRETGTITTRASVDIEQSIVYFNSPDPRRIRVEDPMPREIMGKTKFFVRIMVPVINPNTGDVVGGVGCLLSLEQIQPAVEQIIRDHDEIAAMAIYSSNGFIIGHFIPDRIGSKLLDVDVEYGSNREAASKAVRNGETYKDVVYDPGLDSNIDLVIVSFEIGNSGKTWSVMIGATEEYILTDVRQITSFTIILALVIIIVVAIIVFFVLSRVIRPITQVANTLQDIAQGEGDLTHTIPENGNDEIADLSRYFNQTLFKIRNLVTSIKKEALMLSGIGTELASNMNETAAAVNEITANIQSIKGRVINQSASVSQTHATMEQVVGNINKLNSHVENQSSHVSQASAAIEQMVANISSVTDSLIKNSANVISLKEASEIGRGGLQEVSADIQEIAKESEGLMEINSVMENIASQTNLLSMNAAIEAAHAGEAGKGFAVVADEIRKLAESSSEQSKTIGLVLKKIKGSIDKITRSTENVLNKFEAIDSSVRVVTEQEENIRHAMEEQGEGSKQVLEGVGQLNGITRQVKDGSEEMHYGAKEVIQESDNLERVTQEITGGMNEMASGADQINVAVTHVNDISIKNREGIETLLKEVSKFKIE